MKKIFPICICLSLCFILITCSKSKPSFQAGMWEITTKTIMKGAPMQMPPMTHKQCLTQEDFVPSNKTNKSCVIKDEKISGDKVTWTSECKTQGMTSTGSGEVIYNKDTMKGNVQMTSVVNGKEMKLMMEMSGKRVGDCK